MLLKIWMRRRSLRRIIQALWLPDDQTGLIRRFAPSAVKCFGYACLSSLPEMEREFDRAEKMDRSDYCSSGC